MDLMFKVFKAIQKRSKETHNSFVLISEIREAVPKCDMVYLNFLILSNYLKLSHEPQDPAQCALLPPAEEYLHNTKRHMINVFTMVIAAITMIIAVLTLIVTVIR